MELRKRPGMKKWFIIGIIALAVLLLLAALWITPKPVLKEGVSADRVIYSVNVIRSPYSHRNDVYLTEDETGQDTNAYTVGYLDDEIQDRLETVLQTYEMRRTLRYHRQLKTYNITRIGIDEKPELMEIYVGEDLTLVHSGWSWYRVIQPEELYLEMKDLIDGYILSN